MIVPTDDGLSLGLNVSGIVYGSIKLSELSCNGIVIIVD